MYIIKTIPPYVIDKSADEILTDLTVWENVDGIEDIKGIEDINGNIIMENTTASGNSQKTNPDVVFSADGYTVFNFTYTKQGIVVIQDDSWFEGCTQYDLVIEDIICSINGIIQDSLPSNVGFWNAGTKIFNNWYGSTYHLGSRTNLKVGDNPYAQFQTSSSYNNGFPLTIAIKYKITYK